ncbi:MAG: hypothetical protein HND40_06625 [Ignavibacteriota bacterium]|nr:hypothetical protein [Ignavibacteriota bacterium]MCO6446233.1 hypothetical protein [Ignavibacterium album]MDT3696775.1 hypothetical protein [Ignavibacterium sp.]MEB2297406.1 hypothetical protein [Ignavibacteria bacterium]HOJ07242.1 hypothetical protein [Ignavibacteriaceae bacterium]
MFDEPISGQSRYGPYWMYTLKEQSGEEVLFFAPEEVNEQIKTLKKGDRFEITKLAEQKGTKIVTKYDVKIKQQIPTNNNHQVQKDNYFDAMLSSYQDALKIQEQLNGMVDVNRIAITLFIARSKITPNGYN